MSNQIFLSSGLKVDSPLFNELIEKTTEIMKMSIIQAITNESNPRKYVIKTIGHKFNNININRGKTVGAVVANRFNKMNPKAQNIVMRNIKGLRTVEPKLMEKIKSLGLNVVNGNSVLNQIDIKKEFAFLSTKDRLAQLYDEMKDILDRFNHGGHGGFDPGDYDPGDLVEPDEPDEPTPPVILNHGLKLKLHSVKCLDETEPEWIGSDEISMGGVTLNDKNNEESLSEFEVYNGFDDNDVKSYNPPRVLRQFNLDAVYPKTFSAFIVLAEKDNGGFSNFIAELYKSIKVELQIIIDALGVAAGALIGSEIGGELGAAVGGPIGAIIGIAVGAILGALIGWIIYALSDDIFPTQMAMVALPAGDAAFSNGSLDSPVMSLFFEAHGGKYEMRYNWEIVR